MHLKTQQLLPLAILTFITICCTHGSYKMQLVGIDSLISKNMDDSAQAELSRIVPDESTLADDMAYYNMLKVELLFRSGEVLPNDSMINISIAKFQENGDNHKLAQSLYFKGRIQFKRGETKSAIKNLLEAKEAAKETGDGTLKAKIYGNLAFFNMTIGKYKYAKKYILHALNCIPDITEDKYILKADIYQNASDIFGNLRDTANAIAYMKKCIPLLKHVDATGKANIYSGLANIYNVEGDFERAKRYGLLALKQRQKHDTYYILSETFRQLGDTATANAMWGAALKTAGNTYKTMMLTEKMEAKLKNEEYEEASTLGNEIIKMHDSLATKHQADSITEILATFDMAKNAANNLSTWKIYTAGIAIAAAVLACVLPIIYRIRITTTETKFNKKISIANKTLGNALESNQELRAELNSKLKIIAKQNDENKSLQKTAGSLAKQLEEALSANRKMVETAQLEAQKCILEMYEMAVDVIVHNKCITKWCNDKIARFIGYCSCAMPELNAIFKEAHKTLTTQNKLMLILQHFNKSKEDICLIMNLSESAYRQAVSRLSKKMGTEATEHEKK